MKNIFLSLRRCPPTELTAWLWHAAYNKHRHTDTKHRDNHEARRDSVSQETEPGSTHHGDEIPNMNARALPLPRAGHGCLCAQRSLGRRGYPSRWFSRECHAAGTILRYSSSRRAAEITKQLSLIGLNELSCREDERKGCE